VGELIRRLGRPRPAPDLADAAAGADVARALARLPPKLSIAFLLRHYHGYSTAEVAVITGTPERTVRHHAGAGGVPAASCAGERLGPSLAEIPAGGGCPGVRRERRRCLRRTWSRG